MQQGNKIIHYFLDGKLDFDYRDSWAKHAPDWELKHWSCSNMPVDIYPELQDLINSKRYSNLSDFTRSCY